MEEDLKRYIYKQIVVQLYRIIKVVINLPNLVSNI